MTLSILPPKAEAAKWAAEIAAYTQNGRITNSELEAVIGRLSLAPTSVFGRIGRAILSPIYAKLHSSRYETYSARKTRQPCGG